MANSYHHAVSSARRFGGVPADYQPIHDFLDSSKAAYADARHRAVLHHTLGIFIAERVFGHAIVNSAGRAVPVRVIAEQHVKEDHGRIPTVKDWLGNLPVEKWMGADAERLSATDGVSTQELALRPYSFRIDVEGEDNVYDGILWARTDESALDALSDYAVEAGLLEPENPCAARWWLTAEFPQADGSAGVGIDLQIAYGTITAGALRRIEVPTPVQELIAQ